MFSPPFAIKVELRNFTILPERFQRYLMGVAKGGQIKFWGTTNGFNRFPTLKSIGIEPQLPQ